MEMNINYVDLQEAWTRKNEKAIKRNDIQQVCEEVFSATTTFYMQYYLFIKYQIKKPLKTRKVVLKSVRLAIFHIVLPILSTSVFRLLKSSDVDLQVSQTLI